MGTEKSIQPLRVMLVADRPDRRDPMGGDDRQQRRAVPGVSIQEGRLQSCLFIGPDHGLPKRDWLVQLFDKEELTRQERLRLLTGTPGNAREDAVKKVCAYLGVGVNTLIRGIREQGLRT